jgi:hypothetical protein
MVMPSPGGPVGLYLTALVLNDPDFFLIELCLQAFLLGLPEAQVAVRDYGGGR